MTMNDIAYYQPEAAQLCFPFASTITTSNTVYMMNPNHVDEMADEVTDRRFKIFKENGMNYNFRMVQYALFSLSCFKDTKPEFTEQQRKMFEKLEQCLNNMVRDKNSAI